MSNPKYPIVWASRVVSTFLEKYARGYHNFKALFPNHYHLAYNLLVHILCEGKSWKWERIKAVIKTLEDYDYEKIKGFSAKERILLYKYLGFSFDEQVMDGEFIDLGIDK